MSEAAHRLPLGFLYAKTAAGTRVKKADLALIFSEVPAAAAGCMTQSRARAASCARNATLLPSASARAVITNSGNANSMTGPEGPLANRRMALALAEALGVAEEAILTCSTGVIGVPLPIGKIVAAVLALVHALGPDPQPVAEAIMTTDTEVKVATREVFLGGDRVSLLGIAKGSGMVHPNMATTLGYVLTDAAVTPSALDAMLRAAVDDSFNMISVDRDTSTNDAVLCLANGLAENPTIDDASSPEGKLLAAAITEVCRALARAVAADGEGARRLLTVKLTGADTRDGARALARSVVESNLTKAAMFGADPNWGRMLAAMGARAAELDLPLSPDHVRLTLQGTLVFDGKPVAFDADGVRSLLRRREIAIDIRVGDGPHEATAWGCDLSYDYVRINADYAAVLVDSPEGPVRRDTRLENKTPELKADTLVQALRYIERFSGTRAVIKYGGAAMIRDDLKDRFAEDVRLLRAVGLQPIIVHGGGTEISRVLESMGQTSRFIDGLRVTEEAHLRVVEMVLCGQINGQIVAALTRAHARAVGLSGKDGGLVSARKLLSPSGADLGFVGEVTRVDPTLLELLLGQGYLPVLSPIGMGEDGQTYNLNADAVAAETAIACRAKKLIYISDGPGILSSDGQLISEISADELATRVEDGTLDGGMVLRAQSVLRALSGGVESAHIIDGRIPHNVVAELFTSRGVGTMIRAGVPGKGEEVTRGD
jgi:acetylglutamate kinase